MTTTRSADGTVIGFEHVGSGPPAILVDGAILYRRFGPMAALAQRLAADFAVWTYDRRGRGDSGDTPPYQVEREVEDLAAVLGEAGGSAFVYGLSSGALLALQAAAAGLDIPRLVVFEPPVLVKPGTSTMSLAAELAELAANGRRWDAVERFQATTGMSPEMVAQMAERRPDLESIAPTLVYDLAIVDSTSLDTVASVRTPTLVLDSTGSAEGLRASARAVATALPKGTSCSLAGGWHDAQPEDLASVLSEFFHG